MNSSLHPAIVMAFSGLGIGLVLMWVVILAIDSPWVWVIPLIFAAASAAPFLFKK